MDPHFDEELAAFEAEMAAAAARAPADGGIKVVGEEDWETVADDRYD